MEQEWREGVSEVGGTASVEGYQVMERKAKKVTLIRGRGQAGVKLEKHEEGIQGVVTERTPTQITDQDDWFLLFYRPVFKPSADGAILDGRDYISSKAEMALRLE
ncbi:hypothetical protein OJAV_G00158100 [Oryzias javanicus]|uniref:Uncharacterized protein n=1 Tax=Oryzias javanicus TaxID=123683 RepID=A0A437CIM2_ORYJA|nr:hypothetical protein OJAV_G00158100 [Oryzias javanicus]